MTTAYIDGGSRGNPGPAGYGAWIVDDRGETLAELHGPLGVTTNNVAEYNGLLAALAWAIDQRLPALHVRADSQLLVQQMRGAYNVKHPNIVPLHQRAAKLVAAIGKVTFEYIPREMNTQADRLSNVGMDANGRAGPRSAMQAPPRTGEREQPPAFSNSAVPLTRLFETLAAGEPLDHFLERYPDVSRAQALAALKMACDLLLERVGGSR